MHSPNRLGLSPPVLEYFESAGIAEGTAQYYKFLKAQFSWADFAEYFFKDPRDWSKPLQLSPSQKEAGWLIQYGTPYNLMDDPYIQQLYVQGRLQPAERITMVWGRQTGKTTGCAAINAAAVISHRPFIYTGLFAQAGRRSKDALNRIYKFIDHSEFKDWYGDRKNLEEFNTKHGSAGYAYNSADSIHGLTIHIAFIDEAARFQDKNLIPEAIIPTVNATKGRVILLSTPKGSQNLFAYYHRLGLDQRSRYCANCQFIWPQGLKLCPKCQTKHDDVFFVPGQIDAIKRVVYMPVHTDPFNNPFRTREEIQAIYDDIAAINPALADSQVLGLFVDEGLGLFQRQWFRSAVDVNLQNKRTRKEGIRYYMGVDFGKQRDNTVFVVGHKTPADHIVVDYIKIIRLKTEYHEIKSELLDELEYWNVAGLVCDATGVGEGILDILYHDIRERKLRAKLLSNKKQHKGLWTDYYSKKDILEDAQIKWSRNQISIPSWELPTDDPAVKEFVDQHLKFEAEIPDNRVKIIFGTQAYKDDCVMACCYFLWGVGRKAFISTSGEWIIDQNLQDASDGIPFQDGYSGQIGLF